MKNTPFFPTTSQNHCGCAHIKCGHSPRCICDILKSEYDVILKLAGLFLIEETKQNTIDAFSFPQNTFLLTSQNKFFRLERSAMNVRKFFFICKPTPLDKTVKLSPVLAEMC